MFALPTDAAGTKGGFEGETASSILSYASDTLLYTLTTHTTRLTRKVSRDS